MGRLSLRRPSLLADPQMKNYFIALLLVLVSSLASAASVAIAPGGGVAAVAGGFTTSSNFVGSFSAAAFNSNFTTQVAGKAVTMPASMRMAANAGQFAANAIKITPTGLITSAVAAWLLTQGLEWLNGQWTKTETIPGYTAGYMWCADPGMASEYCGPAHSTTCSSYFSRQPADWRGAFQSCVLLSETATGATYRYYFTGYTSTIGISRRTDGCASGTHYVTGSGCISLKQPAPQSAWDALAASAVPDQVATDLAKAGQPFPLQNPEFNPKQQDIPLGDPYTDPVSGKRFRDKARVTPQSDGKTADVQVSKQEVDANGNPATDPATSQEKPPENVTDPCKQNPEAAGCKPLDDVPDEPLQSKENPFSLNPVSGFGADNAACPAPQTLFTKGGQTITWDWGKFCGFAQGIRPLIIGFAWLTALMIVVSVGRRNG